MKPRKAGPQHTPVHKTFNTTQLTEEQVAQLPLIGSTRNNWSQRDITLRAHPTDDTRLISIGKTFDGTMTVIADEERANWATALDYIAHGKVYVRD